MYETDNQKVCLTAAQCTDKSAKAFSATGECIETDADESFDENDNVYACRDDKYVFIKDGSASCVSREECVVDKTLREATKQCLTDAQCEEQGFLVRETDEGETRTRRCIDVCPEMTPAYHKDKKACMTCQQFNEAQGKDASGELYWDGKQCVSSCGGKSVSVRGSSCVSECPDENQVVVDGRCVCAGNTALAFVEDRCVVPSAGSDCKRRADVGGVQTCIREDVCSGDLKLAEGEDGFTCVSECESGKHEEDGSSGELRCVQDCGRWSKADGAGLCKEAGWLKGTVIAVPIAVVVIVVAVVVTCKKKKAKAGATAGAGAEMHPVKRQAVTSEA